MAFVVVVKNLNISILGWRFKNCQIYLFPHKVRLRRNKWSEQTERVHNNCVFGEYIVEYSILNSTRRMVYRKFSRKKRKRRIILHHHNASFHTSAKTSQYLSDQNFELMDFPRYSPNLAPNNFSMRNRSF